MAQAQTKPTSSGSFQNVNKSASNVTSLSVAVQQHVLEAANYYTICQGSAGPWKVRGDKLAAAVGRVMQWA